MLTVIAMLLGLGLLITSQVSVLSAELPAYQSTIRAKIQGLGQQMDRLPAATDVDADTEEQEGLAA